MSEKSEYMRDHPWGKFLCARYHVIHWMLDEMGYDFKQIAEALSMDADQVYLISGSKHFADYQKKGE